MLLSICSVNRLLSYYSSFCFWERIPLARQGRELICSSVLLTIPCFVILCQFIITKHCWSSTPQNKVTDFFLVTTTHTHPNHQGIIVTNFTATTTILNAPQNYAALWGNCNHLILVSMRSSNHLRVESHSLNCPVQVGTREHLLPPRWFFNSGKAKEGTGSSLDIQKQTSQPKPKPMWMIQPKAWVSQTLENEVPHKILEEISINFQRQGVLHVL